MIIKLESDEFEAVAVKPHYSSPDCLIVMSKWNQVTPYKVWQYSIKTGDQSGSGRYCYSWKEAIELFNEMGG